MSSESRDVYLQMQQGPTPGRVFPLADGASLSIGRLPDCGVTCPEDLVLSRLHAVVERRGPDCWLVNRSSNGTFVNNEGIERIRLIEGDVIRCSQLTLKFLGDQEPDQSLSFQWERATENAVVQGDAADRYRFGETRMPCGWSWLTPRSADLSRDVILHQLESLSLSATLIVDWRRTQMEVPPETPDGQPLFHWLPAESARLASPMVLPWARAKWSQSLLEQGTGKDALVWLFSERPFDEVFVLLQQATGYGTSSGLLGFCWPSVLSQILKHQSGEMIQRVLAIGPVWLIDQPDGWTLAVSPAVRERLLERGWRLDSDQAASLEN